MANQMYDDILYGPDVFENMSLGLDDPAHLLGTSRALADARVGQTPGAAAIVTSGEAAPFLGLSWPQPTVDVHVQDTRQYRENAVGQHSAAAGCLGETAVVGQQAAGTSVPPRAAMEERNTSCNSGNSSCVVGEDNEGSGHGEHRGAPVHQQNSNLILANKQHLQRNNRRFKKGAPVPAASGSPKECSTSDEETNGQLGNRKSTPHSTVEKARRDRLNHLIEALAELVPASDRKYSSEAGGVRRPKHVILSDTHSLLRKLKSSAAHGLQVSLPPDHAASSQVKNQPTLPKVATSEEPADTPRLRRRQRSSSSSELHASQQPTTVPLDMPVPFGMGPGCTGVLVEQRAVDEAEEGTIAWRVTVTCRDRQGLLLDMASALAKLPITVQAASLRVCSDSSRAQGAFDVHVQDSSLSPDEVQCVMNAAMYAYLIDNSQGMTGSGGSLAYPLTSAAPFRFSQQERLLLEMPPVSSNKRART